MAQLGITDQDNIQDMQRRKRKAELLRQFNEEVKRFTKKAACIVGYGMTDPWHLRKDVGHFLIFAGCAPCTY